MESLLPPLQLRSALAAVALAAPWRVGWLRLARRRRQPGQPRCQRLHLTRHNPEVRAARPLQAPPRPLRLPAPGRARLLRMPPWVSCAPHVARAASSSVAEALPAGWRDLQLAHLAERPGVSMVWPCAGPRLLQPRQQPLGATARRQKSNHYARHPDAGQGPSPPYGTSAAPGQCIHKRLLLARKSCRNCHWSLPAHQKLHQSYSLSRKYSPSAHVSCRF
mmetsp:Transcript_70708/g.207056  ORF Transcript_70708/g.207056 Transcript_70708/m.207056 type:complete len:220 (-) Transcript_70708:2491-3150(-)